MPPPQQVKIAILCDIRHSVNYGSRDQLDSNAAKPLHMSS